VSAQPDASIGTIAASVENALRDAAKRIERSETRILLAHVLGLARSDLILHSDRALRSDESRRFDALVARRAAGEPVAYIIGEREFYGLALRVTPGVLIPRPETEHLVEHALERLPASAKAAVLDLGTGSGALAVALGHERARLEIVATDVSDAALGVAAENAARHGVAIEFLRSDWFAALGSRRFRMIVTNPPYVAADDPHLHQGDLRFEPPLALVGGRDGLACLRAIVAGARAHLEPGGWLLLEHGFDQGPACLELLRAAGYDETSDHADLAGQPRVGMGRWRG
jgi:release factor glutamine methyltransferase